MNFLVTGSCFKKCARAHPNEGETTATAHSPVEKVCQKVGAKASMRDASLLQNHPHKSGSLPPL